MDYEGLLNLTRKYYIKTIVPEIVKKQDLYVHFPSFDKHFEKLYKAFSQKTDKKKMDRRQQNTKKVVKPETRQNIEPEEAEDSELEDLEENSPTMQRRGSILKNGDNQDKKSENKELSLDKKVSFEDDSDFTKLGETVIGSPKKSKLTPKEKAELKLKQKKEKKNSKSSKDSKDSKGDSKVGRSWGGVQKVTQENMDELDVMAKIRRKKGLEKSEQKVASVNKEFFEGGDDLEDFDFELISEDEEDKEDEKKTKKSSILSSFKMSLSSFAGVGKITEEQLKPVLTKFKNHLMDKNVAEEIARNITDSMLIKLMNTEAQLFSSVSSTVKKCLKETLTNILTPKRKIDVLAEAMKARETGEPYVITFIGVNGVGKSTNLAKVAYLFKNQGFSVLLAACDSFRAGAVKQLETHGNALEIPVFSQGHSADPAKRAQSAIKEAKAKKYDVVLIDTAGRMQDNEPLMKELARLVALNSPKLIIFIGEALVGNDGIDQLTKFNSALIKYSQTSEVQREIDAILVSKFDTVDEKVGAVISMTHSTGKPILFLGTGQKYPNLRKMDVDLVVNMLLS